jgi:hypothetical protein
MMERKGSRDLIQGTLDMLILKTLGRGAMYGMRSLLLSSNARPTSFAWKKERFIRHSIAWSWLDSSKASGSVLKRTVGQSFIN